MKRNVKIIIEFRFYSPSPNEGRLKTTGFKAPFRGFGDKMHCKQKILNYFCLPFRINKRYYGSG
jgi:hypothetical protein